MGGQGDVVRLTKRNLLRNKSPPRRALWMPDIESPPKRPPEIFSMEASSRNEISPGMSETVMTNEEIKEARQTNVGSPDVFRKMVHTS